MGNCLRHKRSYWADDNDDDDKWGSLVSIHREKEGDNGDQSNTMEKERLLHGREVKITISKELEQLVQKMDMQGLSVEQVLANMVNGDVYEVEQSRSWEPVLQSIPEVN